MAVVKKENIDLIIQSIIFPNTVCDEWELYFQTQDKEQIVQKNDSLILAENTTISTNTYMNSFDIQIWNTYTKNTTYKLTVTATGKGTLKVYSRNTMEVIAECTIDTQVLKEYTLELEYRSDLGIVYFEIESKEILQIEKAAYVAIQKKHSLNNIHIDLIICTYKRNDEVKRLLKQIQQSKFFEEGTKQYGALTIRVIDNASQLKIRNDRHVKIYHNPNTGGSGGFSRGILESRKDIESYKTSHVIFMDDDVQILNETLYRLYALLQIVTDEYKERVVAGRMFCMDTKAVQYTAAEIWNAGEILHIGENQDMRKQEYLEDMNKGIGEYSGWWFACFPMKFVEKALPLPFFLHCDDVEYGLRFGSSPLLLNGIQVWHETFENRMTPLIIYYDIRNSMIVNTIYDYFSTSKDAWKWWKQRLWTFSGYVAMVDYLKGKTFFETHTDKKKLMQMHKYIFRILKPILWRVLWFRFRKEGEKAFESYK